MQVGGTETHSRKSGRRSPNEAWAVRNKLQSAIKKRTGRLEAAARGRVIIVCTKSRSLPHGRDWIEIPYFVTRYRLFGYEVSAALSVEPNLSTRDRLALAVNHHHQNSLCDGDYYEWLAIYTVSG